MTQETKSSWNLMSYDTADYIRKATAEEVEESLAAGEEGVIRVDGERCYVEEV